MLKAEKWLDQSIPLIKIQLLIPCDKVCILNLPGQKDI